MNTLIELVDKAVDRYWDSEPHTTLIQGIEALQRENAELRKKLEAVQMAYGLMHGGSKA